jgi:hypothetical protein
METHLAYCSAHDREVRVFVRPVCYDETDPGVDEPPGIVCIEHGEECLGVRCPLFHVFGANLVEPLHRIFRR